jgi:hypothetical protein
MSCLGFVLQTTHQFWRPINTSRPNEFGASAPGYIIRDIIIALQLALFSSSSIQIQNQNDMDFLHMIFLFQIE